MDPQLRPLGLSTELPEQCRNAGTIIQYAHESASSLLKAYNFIRQLRSSDGSATPRGMTTDEEQDLLRAMLVMAAAGLDAAMKQLVRDALPVLVEVDKQVRTGLEKFVTSRIQGNVDATDLVAGAKFLGRVLAAFSHQEQVIDEYIAELTGGSLQSPDELLRTVSALGLNVNDLDIDIKNTKRIFEIRNQIVHELDMQLSGKRRKRRLRKQKETTTDVDTIHEIATRVVNQVAESVKRIPSHVRRTGWAYTKAFSDSWLRIIRKTRSNRGTSSDLRGSKRST